MIIITIDDSLNADSAKIYTGTKPDADVTSAIGQVAQERSQCQNYSIDHKVTPTKLDITCTSSNPTCIQIGGILFCW